jgi:hypothetical protein
MLFPLALGAAGGVETRNYVCLERGCRAEVHLCSLAQAPTHMACRRLQRFTGAGDGLTV